MYFYVEMPNYSLSESRPKSTQGKFSGVYGVNYATALHCLSCNGKYTVMIRKVSGIVSRLNSVSQGISDYLQLLLSINCPLPDAWQPWLAQAPCSDAACAGGGAAQGESKGPQGTSCIGGCVPELPSFVPAIAGCMGRLQRHGALGMKMLFWHQALIILKKRFYAPFFLSESCTDFRFLLNWSIPKLFKIVGFF